MHLTINAIVSSGGIPLKEPKVADVAAPTRVVRLLHWEEADQGEDNRLGVERAEPGERSQGCKLPGVQ